MTREVRLSICDHVSLRLRETHNLIQDRALSATRLIADKFVEWQTSYGRPDPERSPFVTQGKCFSTQFHSPTFIAIGLYRAYEDTGEPCTSQSANAAFSAVTGSPFGTNS